MAEAVTPTSPTMSSEYTEDQHHSSTPATSDDDDDDSEVGHGYPRMRTAFRVMAVSFICAVIGILFILVPFVLTPNPMANMKRYIATGRFTNTVVFSLELNQNHTYARTHARTHTHTHTDIYVFIYTMYIVNIYGMKLW